MISLTEAPKSSGPYNKDYMFFGGLVKVLNCKHYKHLFNYFASLCLADPYIKVNTNLCHLARAEVLKFSLNRIIISFGSPLDSLPHLH